MTVLPGLFQSTHPARGATLTAFYRQREAVISIHAPREGCDVWTGCAMRWWTISIHAPREGCDYRENLWCADCIISIHAPREGCDDGGARLRRTGGISIHAPREGCDRICTSSGAWDFYFNPRTPRGVRPTAAAARTSPRAFQSTHPARGATANFTKEQRVCLAQFAYLHKGKKAEHTKTNAPMLHEAFLYAFWVRTGRRRRVLLDFARYKIKGSSGR